MNWYKVARNHKEQIPGGKAEGKQPRDYPKDQVDKGISVEYEHTNDKNISQEIAMDHLEEFDDYYTGLDEMEKKLEKGKKKKTRLELEEGL